MKNVLKMALLGSLFVGVVCYAQDMSSSSSMQQPGTTVPSLMDMKAQLPSDWQTMTMDQKKDWLKKEYESLTPKQRSQLQAKLRAGHDKWKNMSQDDRAKMIQAIKEQVPASNNK